MSFFTKRTFPSFVHAAARVRVSFLLPAEACGTAQTDVACRSRLQLLDPGLFPLWGSVNDAAVNTQARAGGGGGFLSAACLPGVGQPGHGITQRVRFDHFKKLPNSFVKRLHCFVFPPATCEGSPPPCPAPFHTWLLLILGNNPRSGFLFVLESEEVPEA